jgi:hypothetical protein
LKGIKIRGTIESNYHKAHQIDNVNSEEKYKEIVSQHKKWYVEEYSSLFPKKAILFI